MRSISKEDFFKILATNTSFNEIELQENRAFEISSYEAFLFSTITGAQYLDNLIFPFTPKGLMKIFHSHMNNRFVTGLWSGVLPHYTPRKLVADRPFLARDSKILIPVEFRDENDFANEVAKLFKYQTYPGQILVHRIESSKDGCGQESLLEYLSCDFYRKKGFLVDSQIPLPQQFGSPDWMAISPLVFPSEIDLFNSRYIFELGMKSIDWGTYPVHSRVDVGSNFDLIVGEAKVASVDPTKQITKYLSSGIFHRAVLSITDFAPKFLELSDQLYFDQSWCLNSESIHLPTENVQEKSKEFAEFLFVVSKFYLLSNYSDLEISEILDLDLSLTSTKQAQLLSKVQDIPLEKLLRS
jgi:hypothetical protein